MKSLRPSDDAVDLNDQEDTKPSDQDFVYGGIPNARNNQSPEMARQQSYFGGLMNQSAVDDVKKNITAPSYSTEYLAGSLAGLKGMGELANKVSQNNILGYITKQLFPEPADTKDYVGTALEDFDPYKLLGTENKSLKTVPGAIQGLGELFAGGGFARPAGEAAKALSYLRPNAAAQSYVAENLGKGTAEQNIEDLTGLIYRQKQYQLGEISPLRQELKDMFGEKKLYQTPESTVDLNQQAGIPKPNNANYRDNMPEIGEYNTDIREAHNDYIKNPTLNNNYTLSTRIGDRQRELNDIRIRTGLDDAQKQEFKALKSSSDKLKDDRMDFLKEQGQQYADQEEKFNDLYKKNVSIYEKTPTLSQMTKAPKEGGISTGDIAQTFKDDPNYARTIIAQNPQIKGKVLYNALLQKGVNMSSSSKIAEGIRDLQQRGGYGYMIDPELEKAMQDWSTRSKARAVAGGAVGGVGGAFLGHPVIGAALGAGAPSVPDLVKMLFKLKGKL